MEAGPLQLPAASCLVNIQRASWLPLAPPTRNRVYRRHLDVRDQSMKANRHVHMEYQAFPDDPFLFKEATSPTENPQRVNLPST